MTRFCPSFKASLYWILRVLGLRRLTGGPWHIRQIDMHHAVAMCMIDSSHKTKTLCWRESWGGGGYGGAESLSSLNPISRLPGLMLLTWVLLSLLPGPTPSRVPPLSVSLCLSLSISYCLSVPLCLSLHLLLSLSLSLSLCLSLRLLLSLCVPLSLSPFLTVFHHLSLSLPLSPSLYLSLRLFISLSVSLSLSPSLYLSLSLSVLLWLLLRLSLPLCVSDSTSLSCISYPSLLKETKIFDHQKRCHNKSLSFHFPSTDNQ
jgi:hypothetical protein